MNAINFCVVSGVKTHIAVTNSEIHYPLPNCIYIHCLVPINVQQVLMNINGCNFFYKEEFK